jgi:hypothetical protein
MRRALGCLEPCLEASSQSPVQGLILLKKRGQELEFGEAGISQVGLQRGGAMQRKRSINLPRDPFETC